MPLQKISLSRGKAKMGVRAHRPTAPSWPPLALLRGLLATLALAIAPHATRLPLWLIALVATVIAWRYLAAHQKWPLPNKWMLLTLAAAATLGILLQYHTLFGRDAGVALFTLMVTFKLLELKSTRDVWLLVFLGYFLVLTHFLYSQSLFIAAYLFFITWLFTTILIAFSQPRAQLPWPTQFKLSAQLLLQAVPVMLVLFVLFPRISGPLWGLPSDAFAGQTGLSDSMAPGAISHLAQSDTVAFRVEYAGKLPPAIQRYFRVLVLDRLDGRTWYAHRVRPMNDTLQAQGTGTRYTITLEPNNKPWLPVMDYADPTSLPLGSQLNADFSVTQKESVQQRKRYSATSYLAFGGTLTLEADDLPRALQLPPGGNPRARELARELRRASRDDLDFANRVLAKFHNEPFVYTLQPPRLGSDSVDEFLFDTRRGFCEHYAGSFAYLMRAGGVPARIVTGYQGGEFNQLGNYLIVRQADAHAWTEVWLDHRGWVRVDPTAAVSPNRIEQGIASALPAGEALPLFLREPSPWLKQLKFSWDTFNNRWNQWVLGYDQERQVSLFARLGFGIVSWQDLGIYLLIGIGSVIGLLALFTLRGRREYSSKVERTYAAFCARLARVGIVRGPAEGPLDFANRTKTLRPDLAPRIEVITRLYVALRYGADAKTEWVRDFARIVAQFRAEKLSTQARYP
jgi:transglutaminase-like putative cysteine protease